MYWMWENYVSDILSLRKLCKRCTDCEKIMYEMYWVWENCVTDVLNVRKLCKRCTDCEKNM